MAARPTKKWVIRRWWFRNPIPNHRLDVLQTLVNHGIIYQPQLVSQIFASTVPKLLWNDFLKLSPTCWYSTIQQGPPKSRWVLVEDPGSVEKIWHSGLLKQSCVKGFPLQKHLCKNCPVYPPCLALLSRCFPGIPEIFSFSSFKISSVGRGRDEGSYWVTRLAIYFNYIPAFVKYFELDVQN